MKVYNSPISETTILEAGILCDGDPMAASPGNHGQKITPIMDAPQRKVY